MRNAQQAIDRNRGTMRRFETCINTNDLELGRTLIAETAAFKTPVSPTPLYGAEGYLGIVGLMRKSFPDVQWKLADMVADEERKLRSSRVRGMVSLPFLLLPRTPSSSLPSLPYADAQGWNSTLLDNAGQFRMKFTVADPFMRVGTVPRFLRKDMV